MNFSCGKAAATSGFHATCDSYGWNCTQFKDQRGCKVRPSFFRPHAMKASVSASRDAPPSDHCRCTSSGTFNFPEGLRSQILLSRASIAAWETSRSGDANRIKEKQTSFLFKWSIVVFYKAGSKLQTEIANGHTKKKRNPINLCTLHFFQR